MGHGLHGADGERVHPGRVHASLINPLPTLADQIGVPVEDAARICNVSLERATDAFKAKPDDPLDTFLQLLNGLGLCVRVRVGVPPTMWVRLSVIDAMYYDDGWRVAHGRDEENRPPAATAIDAQAVGWLEQTAIRLATQHGREPGRAERVATIRGSR